MTNVATVHGTTVVLSVDGCDRAVMLTGAPGSGKSDLALRMIDRGAQLLADDRTQIYCVGDGATPVLMARPPAALAGRLEVRGIGLVTLPWVGEAPLALMAELVTANAVVRLPERRTTMLLGVAVPLVAVAPFEISAVLKLGLALQRHGLTLSGNGAGEPS